MVAYAFHTCADWPSAGFDELVPMFLVVNGCLLSRCDLFDTFFWLRTFPRLSTPAGQSELPYRAEGAENHT